MKNTAGLTAFAQSALLLALGCGPDTRITDPGTHPAGDAPALASGSYSAWSDPQNLGGLVNSAATEQQPALSKDGLSLYFASNRTGGLGAFDIWVAQRACRDGCPWDAAQVVTALNSQFPDISPGLSRDGHQLFFASQRPNGHCSVNPPATAQCDRDLWVSYREDVHNDFGWQTPVNLGDVPNGVNSANEELAPSYLENDEADSPQLFFNNGVISGGALVGGDIYVSQMVDGIWGLPSPVAEINSPFSDQRPSISHDGLELYFWSDRDGAAQLWVATRESASDSWSDPVLLPSPINDAPTIQPFIYAHGRTETLLFVRGVPGTGSGRDLWMSERTRLSSRE
jgi:hypothetical protein